jgi:hypothetical protein
MPRDANEISSAGHKLGQLVGDWFEEFFVFPLLTKVANELDLFLDNRFVDRPARGEKIEWEDNEGNAVDYDFVLELNGRADKRGIPVAFVECFWRRGARHSKDKARDDSGKLLPMGETYPTARFLGIVAAGDFTEPARDLVRGREIDLFYIPKDKVVQAFSDNDLAMDYPDSATEGYKSTLAGQFEVAFTKAKHRAVAHTLTTLVGAAATASYVHRVRARLSALPQEIRLILRHESRPLVFRTVGEVTEFLKTPSFRMDDPRESYLYQVTYSDGTEFERSVVSVDDLRTLHGQIQALADHMTTTT